MIQKNKRFNDALATMAFATLLTLPGCGARGQQPVRGAVTVDNEPVSVGEIIFIPTAGTTGPTAGGTIKDGGFSLSREKGLGLGTYRVEINAPRPSGRKVRGPRGEQFDELINYLPKRYNANSELTVQVTADGPNVFEFALKSK